MGSCFSRIQERMWNLFSHLRRVVVSDSPQDRGPTTTQNVSPPRSVVDPKDDHGEHNGVHQQRTETTPEQTPTTEAERLMITLRNVDSSPIRPQMMSTKTKEEVK